MRYIIGILALIGVIGALAAVKADQIRLLIRTGAAAEEAGPPPEVVSTVVATEDTWGSVIDAIGSVEANQGVAIANDAPGVVTRVSFESGEQVKRGHPLVQLDASVERAQLTSAISRRDLAQTTLKRVRALVSSGALAAEELDQAESAHRTTNAEVAGLRAQIAKKVVRAPFAGKLGIRRVNLGQYLNPGTTLTTLQSTTDDYVDFAIPQQRLSDVQVGFPVQFKISGGVGNIIDGEVAAINSEIDPNTRTVTIRAKTKDDGAALLPGMFVSASIQLPTKRNVVLVPTTAVIYATFGNSVFVVEESEADGESRKTARQQFVQTGESRGDFVTIENGLEGGETIVSAGGFKLRNGARVRVNNEVVPEAQLAPTPDNR